MRARVVGLGCTIFVAAIGPSLLLVPSAFAELAEVWAVDDGVKVKRSATAHPMRNENAVWDGSRVRLFGARNETVAFQVLLVGGQRQTASVGLRLDNVGPIGNSEVSNDPDRYFIGRNIELFKQEYVQVSERSSGLVWSQPAAVPAGLNGWLPDPLVPLNISGVFSVPQRQVQGTWVDIYIPKGTAPGVHRGTLTVEVGGQVCAQSFCRIPVELEVLDLTLPDKPTAKTMLWFGGADLSVQNRYFQNPRNASLQQIRTLMARHFKLARRHHVTLFSGGGATPDGEADQRLSGEAFTPAQGYYGWGQGQPQDMFSIQTYGHGGGIDQRQAQQWIDYFQRFDSGIEYFLYAWDEPGRGQYGEVNAKAARAADMPAFVTAPFESAMPDVDIFCNVVWEFSAQAMQQATANGRRLWVYNGTRPFSGSFATDDVAVSTRMQPWLQFKYGIPRWFYWDSTYYIDFQGGRGDLNIWREALNFTNRWGDRVNGDGLLIYPGRDFRFPAEDRGFDGPLPSIRLKNWRRGIQDVEYLNLARQRGHASRADQAVQTLIPNAVMSNTDHDRAVAWQEDGNVWFGVRRELATLLSPNSGSDPGVDSPPGDDVPVQPPPRVDEPPPVSPSEPPPNNLQPTTPVPGQPSPTGPSAGAEGFHSTPPVISNGSVSFAPPLTSSSPEASSRGPALVGGCRLSRETLTEAPWPLLLSLLLCLRRRR